MGIFQASVSGILPNLGSLSRIPGFESRWCDVHGNDTRLYEAVQFVLMSSLSQLFADIDTRVLAIRGDRADWLCAKGCDSCCRRLAELPRLTAAEWNFLRHGLMALTPERLRGVRRDSAGLAASAAPAGRSILALVCPLLDQASGACTVYAYRPVACRTYGFYVQRDLGLYCHDIESRVVDGALADIVWGNHDAIDQRLNGLGEQRTLTEWLERWDSGR